MLELDEGDLLAIERELCRRSLAEFAQRAWHVLEPATPLKWGWVLDGICEHLEAVTHGDIHNLLANVPPGSMKSLLTAVIWPAWEWGPAGKPENRFLGTAHSQNIAIRDNMKCRRLIQSHWYQRLWPTKLMIDQNSKIKFENDAMGFREAMAFTKMTGSRGDRVILDDPIGAHDANSPAMLYDAEIAFTETLPTRINSEESSIVVIMQRLNEGDTSGLILERGLDFEHFMVPMRFEPGRRCKTSIGWEDPREKEGELMFPERFPESQVDELEKTMGSYAVAGQLQQRPSPRGGGMFKRRDFAVLKAAPAGVEWVRGWDLAATEDKTAARTAGVLLGRKGEAFYIGDVVKGQLSPGDVERLIVNTASQDGVKVRGSIPQDPGQAGKSQKRYIIGKLAGYTYHATPETGDKITRAQPLAAQVEAGNVFLIDGPWVKEFLDECELFPAGKFKDQVDAASRAFAEFVGKRPKVVQGKYG